MPNTVKPFKITAWYKDTVIELRGPLPHDAPLLGYDDPDMPEKRNQKMSATKHRRYGLKSRSVEDGE